MIKTLMTIIREFVTRGITALPLKEISSWDLSKGVGGVRFGFTLMEEALKSWIVGNFHFRTWLHLLNVHSIELYKIWWSSFEWSDLVVPISWWGRPCMSSLAQVGWCLQLPHQSEASDIFWVGRHETCCELSIVLKVTPIDMTTVHTSQWWDTD
jgi:hypothetical protein